jgi:hypothetical protein
MTPTSYPPTVFGSWTRSARWELENNVHLHVVVETSAFMTRCCRVARRTTPREARFDSRFRIKGWCVPGRTRGNIGSLRGGRRERFGARGGGRYRSTLSDTGGGTKQQVI